MRIVKTERFIEQIMTGSLPCKFECSDGETYFIKHIGNNPRHVINEFIGAKILQFLDLPTPEIALVEVVLDALDGEVFAYNRVPNGFAFGSKQIQGQTSLVLPSDLYKELEIRRFMNAQSIIGIVLFDIWVRNIDRGRRNPNLLIQQVGKNNYQFVAIDQAMIFAEKEYAKLSVVDDAIYWPNIQESLVSHPIYRQLHDSLGLFVSEESERVLSRIESVGEKELYEVLLAIPSELRVGESEKESIIRHYLLPRKHFVRGVFKKLLIEAKIQEL